MYDGTSDFGRIQRQNAFLKALINQAEKQYNPLTLNAFIGSVVQGVTIDSTFTICELVSAGPGVPDFASTNPGHGDAAHLLAGRRRSSPRSARSSTSSSPRRTR